MTYEVFTITPEMAIGKDSESIEETGYLPKFWVNHPQMGRTLVKLEQETAPAWSEKVASEIALLLNIPVARYEFGELQGFQQYENFTKIVVSPNFKQPQLNYINGTTLLEETLFDYSYTVPNVIQTLSQNQISLPENYQTPIGINDGAELFVGYLMFDYLISNNDRHGGNWEIAIDNRGVKALAPLYDNGASFATTFGSLVYDNYTPERYMETDLSMFGEFQAETFKQAAELRSEAAKIWLAQLAKIEVEQLEAIFDRLPRERITPEAKAFAIDLLNYNRTQLLSFQEELIPSTQNLEALYLRYSQDTKTQGLAEAVEIAKNALSEGIEPKQVTDMLTLLNTAYQDLVARSGAVQARKIVVRKAQVELALSREERASPKQLPKNKQSKGKNR